jgi:hypothetical protein
MGNDSLTGEPRVESDPDRFVAFIQEIDKLAGDERLFPRSCRVCGKNFRTLAEYLCATVPRGHCYDDCRTMRPRPFMMVYRHCTCGNTLVLSVDDQVFPVLDLFWKMLEEESERTGQSLKEVVSDFAVQCDCYLLSQNNPCEKKP